MKQVTQSDGASQNIVQENIQQLKEIFPDAFTEGGIDFDVLRQLLGDASILDEGIERFGLNWHGKKQARQIALTPSMGTLLPCPEESVDWDTTQNLFIEGDNLEVLKLLRQSYANKVKVIYIDPPYNTGKEFVYSDNFKDNLNTYLEYTKQFDEGVKVSTDTETSGRKHTNWLNMMYPRLSLAHALLKKDGILFVSIDDNEVHHLKSMLFDVFGEENFLREIVWQRHAGGGNDSKYFAIDHEYILVFAKDKNSLPNLRIPLTDKDVIAYKGKDKHFEKLGPYKTKSFKRMRPDDPRPGLQYKIKTPDGGELFDEWKWEESRFLEALNEDKVLVRESKSGWVVEYKLYLNDGDGQKNKVPRSLITDVERNSAGKNQIKSLFGKEVFNNPKPTGLIKYLVELGTGEDDKSIILDFFAGSASTADAVLQMNVKDNKSHRTISVQLPEAISEKSPAYKLGFTRISEIGRERLRRIADRLKEDNPETDKDLGFKLFKLSNSNIKPWNPDPDDLEGSLFSENILENRTKQDVLYELLLKRGIDLAIPIENREISSKTVYSIGYGAVFACLDKTINTKDVEALAQGIIQWHRELEPSLESHIFFRDNSFENDVAKTNLSAILDQHSLSHVRSL